MTLDNHFIANYQHSIKIEWHSICHDTLHRVSESNHPKLSDKHKSEVKINGIINKIITFLCELWSRY